MKRLLSRSAFLSPLLLVCACSPQAIHQQVSGSLTLRSTTIVDGVIPDRTGCKGPGASPQLSWSAPPAGTMSLALIMDDRDAPVGHLHRHYYVHWVAFDMPPARRELAEGQMRQALPDGTQQGRNDAREFGFSVPCPYAGTTHHYAITLYALDTRLGLPPDTTAGQLMSAIDGHILARGELLGRYTR